MAVRIGDLLLQDGTITPAQLEEALKYQVIFGGKLGTNLIEMGLVEENDIARSLSRKFNVPAVDAEELMTVGQQIVHAIPRELVEKYGVVPYKLDGRRLSLVVPDPSDLKTLDDIGFRTGLVIRPVVAAEVRIVLALEQLYQIERDRRYIHAAKRIVSKRKPAKDIAPAPPAAPPTASAASAVLTQAAAEVAAASASVPPAATVAKAASTPAPVAAAVPPPVPAAVEEVLEITDAETVSENLAEARDRDDILDTLAEFLAHEFPRSALFLVRGGTALGWRASIERRSLAGFDQVQIPLDEASVLKTVSESRAFYLGPIPRTPFNSMMLQEIGGNVPDAALLVPLQMMGRVVGIIYADGKGIDLGERLFEVQKLTAKAAMAFEILVLKNKILSM